MTASPYDWWMTALRRFFVPATETEFGSEAAALQRHRLCHNHSTASESKRRET